MEDNGCVTPKDLTHLFIHHKAKVLVLVVSTEKDGNNTTFTMWEL